jgi:hypothetical protein
LEEQHTSDSNDTETRTPKSQRGVVFYFLFLALLTFHVAVNLWWLNEDNHVIRTDEEGHMQYARDYYRAMALDHPGNPFMKLIAMGDIIPTNPIHPPLLHILGAFMIMLFGYCPDTIAATDTVLFVFTLLGCYAIARRFLEPWHALYVMFVVSFTPMIFAASRFFMTDFLSMTLIVWAIYALLRSNYFRNPGWIFIFALLNGLGILTRTPSFFYLLLPSIVVYLLGICTILSPGKGKFLNWKAAQRLFFTAAMTIIVTLSILAPWYLHHLETFYPFWTARYIEESDPEIKAVIAANTAAKAKVKAQNPDKKPLVSPDAPYAKWINKVADPETPWKRYPAYAIHQGTFLPMFILSILGALIALLLPRYRSLGPILLIAWILSAWVLMTIVFKYSTARYTLQVMPALAILAALTVMAPPKGLFRNATMSLFALLLLFQYGNLTVRNYGSLQEAYLPQEWDSWVNSRDGKRGLALYKNQLTLSDAYSQLAPPTQKNYKDRIFKAMVDHEKKVPRAGEFANYLRLKMRGMEFDEQHYWPEPNPFIQGNPADMPARKIRSIGMGITPQQLLPQLNQADYIVYFVEQDYPKKEEQWRQYFEERDFETIDHFEEDRFGQVRARIYGVMARKNAGQQLQLTEENIEKLSLSHLYDLINSGTFPDLSPQLQRLTRNRFEEALGSLEFPMADDITLVNLNYTATQPGTMTFEIYFRTERPLAQNYRMYFRGVPDDDDLTKLPPEKREAAARDWDFDPTPPTSQWPVGDYTRVTHTVQDTDITYKIYTGFMTQSGKPHGGQPPIFTVTFP